MYITVLVYKHNITRLRFTFYHLKNISDTPRKVYIPKRDQYQSTFVYDFGNIHANM